MLNERGPLMFINTASTKIEKSAEQTVYDSRNPKTKEKSFIILSNNEIKVDERKIKNIIEMYNKNRPVYCNIKLNNEEIEGYPSSINDGKLRVMINEEKFLELDLVDILSISIIRF